MLDVEAVVGCGPTLGVGAGAACAPVVGVAVVAEPGCGLGPEPVLGAVPGAVWLVEPGAVLAGPEVLVGAACPPVADPAGEIADEGCVLVSAPGLDAVPGAAWLVEPAAVLAAPAVVPGSPVDCPATCPFADWPPEVWACGAAVGPVDSVDLPGSGAIRGWTWSEPVVVEPPRSAAGAWVPGVMDLVVESVVDALLLGSVEAPFEDLPAALPDPVPCCAGSAVAPREVVPAAWEKVGPPRSACGANPVLTVDDRSTVVVSGWEVGWDAAAEFTGVVATGWLVTALVVLAAATFAGAVEALTGWFSGDENDGERLGEPLLGRLERPEEKAAAEYGAGAPG